jgi:hypothetical protein
VQHPAVKVQVTEAEVAHFKAAQPAAVEQSQQQAMLQQFRRQEQAFYFGFTQHHRQGFNPFDAGQLNALVPESFHAEDKAQTVDGKLEVGIGSGGMLLFYEVEVVVYLVRIQLGRQAVEVQGQLGQVVGVIGKRALAAARQGDFLVELLVKLLESCYFSTGSLDKV